MPKSNEIGLTVVEERYRRHTENPERTNFRTLIRPAILSGKLNRDRSACKAITEYPDGRRAILRGGTHRIRFNAFPPDENIEVPSGDSKTMMRNATWKLRFTRNMFRAGGL